MATCPSPTELDEYESESDSGYEYDSSVNPSSVVDHYWVWCSPPWEHLLGETYGKWLVFKSMPTGELDEMWHTIVQCVENGEFGEGCTGAKCSTTRENPDEAPVGSRNGVICVYTTTEAMDGVGLLLIQKVRQTIRYKTDETTLAGRYAYKGHGKVTVRTLYWNDGQPSFGPRTLPADVNPTSIIDDVWVYCTPPSSLATDGAALAAYHGKWLIFEPMVSLDETWHTIRRAVESGEFGKGYKGARCSTSFRPNNTDSDGVIQVSTTKEGMEEVGMKIINKLKRDILYRHKNPAQADRYHGRPLTTTWLYWNDGQPSFGHHRTRPADVNPTSVTDDRWVQCKPPSAPEDDAHDTTEVHGKWQIFEPMVSLDETWHTIRRAVENGEFGKGCIVVRCSTALKPKNRAPDSDGVIEISTTKEGMDEVGMKLINKVERDIQYQHNVADEHPQASRYHRRGPMKTRLYWNNGKPSFGRRTQPPNINPTSVTDKRWVQCRPPYAPAAAYHGKWQIFEPMDRYHWMKRGTR